MNTLSALEVETDDLKALLYRRLLDKPIGTLGEGEAHLVFHLSKEPCIQSLFNFPYLRERAR